eukprot:c8561_g1_i3.p1 GENE.c8561_g1_i3~~c8561_g1_i3.p1  ORF type:complete len:213 (-),score=64.04 c8561_g1_i3:186-824(-)
MEVLAGNFASPLTEDDVLVQLQDLAVNTNTNDEAKLVGLRNDVVEYTRTKKELFRLMRVADSLATSVESTVLKLRQNQFQFFVNSSFRRQGKLGVDVDQKVLEWSALAFHGSLPVGGLASVQLQHTPTHTLVKISGRKQTSPNQLPGGVNFSKDTYLRFRWSERIFEVQPNNTATTTVSLIVKSRMIAIALAESIGFMAQTLTHNQVQIVQL